MAPRTGASCTRTRAPVKPRPFCSKFHRLAVHTGERLAWDWSEEREETPDELLVFAEDLARAWDAVLTADFDTTRMLDTRSSRLKAGVLLAQALHHANVHREQVCAVITSLGLTPPDVSGWAYGRATGGIVPK